MDSQEWQGAGYCDKRHDARVDDGAVKAHEIRAANCVRHPTYCPVVYKYTR